MDQNTFEQNNNRDTLKVEKSKSGIDILKIMSIKKRALIVGDVLLDEYISGSHKRFADEGPVPVFDKQNETKVLGGSGNLLSNLVKLGMLVDIVTLIGAGDHDVIKLIENLGVATDNVVISDEYCVERKRRYVVQDTLVFRCDTNHVYHENETRSSQLLDKLNHVLEKNRNSYDVVLLSDYRRGVLTADVCQKVIKFCNEAKIPTICDPPRSSACSKFCGCTIIKPNLQNAKDFLGKEVNNITDITPFLHSFTAKYGVKCCVLTLASKGVAVLENNDSSPNVFSIPALCKSPIDILGAGDSFMAGLAFGLAHSNLIFGAVHFANLCAASVVKKTGTHTMDLLEVVTNKILRHQTEIKNLRKAISPELKLVMTCGCFDMLHAGHILALQQSKALGNILVVALNSDVSVKNRKGDKRPVINDQQRAIMLLETKSVDFVVIFDEHRPTWICDILLPDIMTKGNDYTYEKISRDFPSAKSVVITDTVGVYEDASTTMIINKITSLNK